MKGTYSMTTKVLIEVIPYQEEWPSLFKREEELLKANLGENCIALHHIGSTSVVGLVAKPKIDILAVIKSRSQVIELLEKIGFKYKGEYNIPLHYGFSKRGEVDVNLHLYEEGHPEIELNLVFRDFLRQHPKAKAEYAALKQQLLADPTSLQKNNSAFSNYTLRKGDFIREILKRAGFNRLRVMKCNDDTEWKAAALFRQTYFFDQIPIADPYTWTFSHAKHAHLILYLGTQIMGYSHIQFWNDFRAALRIIVVSPQLRNQGYGSQFLTVIEKWLKRKGYKSLHIESSPEAFHFYQKNDYQEMAFDDPDQYESDPRDIAIGKLL